MLKKCIKILILKFSCLFSHIEDGKFSLLLVSFWYILFMERENIDKGILFQLQYFFSKFLVCFKIFLRFHYIWERSLFFLNMLLSKIEKYDDTNLVNDIRYLYFFLNIEIESSKKLNRTLLGVYLAVFFFFLFCVISVCLEANFV